MNIWKKLLWFGVAALGTWAVAVLALSRGEHISAPLGGGVHDMIVLFASIRRGGKTLGQMVKEEIGPGVGLLALVSVLAIMIILLAVLALVVVQALAQSPWGIFTIAVTIPLALIMGIALRTGKVSVVAVTIFGLL